MKVLTILLFLVIGATSAFSQTGWFRLNSGVKAKLTDVAFADSLHGIVTAEGLTALRTSDGGSSWISIQFPDSMSPGLWFIQRALYDTDTSGCILIRNVEPSSSHDTVFYHLYRTTDKGATWTEKNPTPHDDKEINFLDIVFPTPNIGYILG